eukprot:14412-Pleurochrysis_carterae.AAC.3
MGAAHVIRGDRSVGELAGGKEGGEGISSSRGGVRECGGAGVMRPQVRRRGRPPKLSAACATPSTRSDFGTPAMRKMFNAELEQCRAEVTRLQQSLAVDKKRIVSEHADAARREELL